MPFCKNCGFEISKNQEENFNNLCPDCIRLFKYRKKRGGERTIFIGIIFMISLCFLFLLIDLIAPFFHEYWDLRNNLWK